VSEGVVGGGPGSGEHSSTTTGRTEGRWLKGKKERGGWKGERGLAGNGNWELRPNKHSEWVMRIGASGVLCPCPLLPSMVAGWTTKQAEAVQSILNKHGQRTSYQSLDGLLSLTAELDLAKRPRFAVGRKRRRQTSDMPSHQAADVVSLIVSPAPHQGRRRGVFPNCGHWTSNSKAQNCSPSRVVGCLPSKIHAGPADELLIRERGEKFRDGHVQYRQSG